MDGAPFPARGPRKDGPRYFLLEIDIKYLYFSFAVSYVCSCQGPPTTQRRHSDEKNPIDPN